MSTEPALMSLTSVAKAIAEKRVSSREVTQSWLHRIAQWQPRPNAFMAIEAEAALAAADAADGALAKGGKARRPARRAAGAQGHVLRGRQGGRLCGSKIRRDFVARTTSTALQRLKDAGTIRLGSLQMAEFAYGPTGHNSHYRTGAGPRGTVDSIPRRLVVGVGRGGRGKADLCGVGIRYRRLDPDAPRISAA